MSKHTRLKFASLDCFKNLVASHISPDNKTKKRLWALFSLNYASLSITIEALTVGVSDAPPPIEFCKVTVPVGSIRFKVRTPPEVSDVTTCPW